MKYKVNILIIGIVYLATLFADDIRYLDEVFESVVKTENVVYGNAPDLPFLFWFEWNTYDIDLEMDIYEPVGDTLTNRPVIIFAHTGSFFSGHNETDDMVDLAISAAKRGYVAISINYRLGLNRYIGPFRMAVLQSVIYENFQQSLVLIPIKFLCGAPVQVQ